MLERPESLNTRRMSCIYLQEGKYLYAKNFCTKLGSKLLKAKFWEERKARFQTATFFTLSGLRYDIKESSVAASFIMLSPMKKWAIRFQSYTCFPSVSSRQYYNVSILSSL
jgi:hypothetical protein